MRGQTHWNTKVVMAWHGIVGDVAWHIWWHGIWWCPKISFIRNEMDEMDMDDNTTWMTDLKNSKIVLTLWCKQWLMKQRIEVEWKCRCSMNDKVG